MTDAKKTAAEKLADIQHQLRAPKNKTNTFGKYAYRNAEGIIAAFKSLSIDGACLTCTDALQEVAGQIFVTATARLVINGELIEAKGHAMHPLEKKGMDASQITGSASSYARKYALCGLFAVEDESQDPDSMDNRQHDAKAPPRPAPQGRANERVIGDAKNIMMAAPDLDALKAAFMALHKDVRSQHAVINAKDARKAELEIAAAVDGDGIPDFKTADGSDAGAQ